MLDQLAADRVDRAHVRAMRGSVGPEALQVVVEVREVDQQQRRRMPSIDAIAASAIHAARRDVGRRPQKLKNGKAPSSATSPSRDPPAACRCRGACGRPPGRWAAASPPSRRVPYMLNHQKSLAQVNVGSRRRPSPRPSRPAPAGSTAARTSPPQIAEEPAVADDAVSRGSVPVRNVACTEQVTAGMTARIGAQAP